MNRPAKVLLFAGTTLGAGYILSRLASLLRPDVAFWVLGGIIALIFGVLVVYGLPLINWRRP